MAKIIILGGSGAIGSVAARTLAAGDFFSEVVVADKNVDPADDLVRHAPSRVSVRLMDADDPVSIKQAIGDSSVVLNCIGPFYRYGPPILKAAIELQKDYVDVCDDLDATEQMLALDDAAREAGVSAVIGMGNSPGLANIFARYCADLLLTQVDAVDIYHIHGGESVEGPAVIKHRFHAMESDIPVFVNGEYIQVRMLEESGRALAEETEFKNIGTYTVYPYPHPETITLPKYLKGVRRVTNMGSVLPTTYFNMTMDVIRLGLGSETPVPAQNSEVIPREFAVAFIIARRAGLLKEAGIGGPLGCLKVKVTGSRDGEPHTYIFSMSSRTEGAGEGTGIPAALGAILMSRGRITAKGVLPPEAAIDPTEFLTLASTMTKSLGMGGGLPIDIEDIDKEGRRESVELKL